MTAAERLNNAILTIDMRAPDSPAGVKTAIGELAARWVSYWNSAERRVAPPITQTARLSRFAESYAKAWMLVPESLRAELAHPREIDASAWAAVEDQWAYVLEGNEAAAQAAKDGAAELSRDLRSASGQLVKGIAIVGGVAACVLLAIAVAKPRWT